MEIKFETYTNQSLYLDKKFSGISRETQIITYELLKVNKLQPIKIANTLLNLSFSHIQTIIKILSNHNILNYHMLIWKNVD